MPEVQDCKSAVLECLSSLEALQNQCRTRSLGYTHKMRACVKLLSASWHALGQDGLQDARPSLNSVIDQLCSQPALMDSITSETEDATYLVQQVLVMLEGHAWASELSMEESQRLQVVTRRVIVLSSHVLAMTAQLSVIDGSQDLPFIQTLAIAVPLETAISSGNLDGIQALTTAYHSECRPVVNSVRDLYMQLEGCIRHHWMLAHACTKLGESVDDSCFDIKLVSSSENRVADKLYRGHMNNNLQIAEMELGNDVDLDIQWDA